MIQAADYGEYSIHRQDRCPEFYGLVSDKAIYHDSEVAPLVRQSFPPRMPMREEIGVPERELAAGD